MGLTRAAADLIKNGASGDILAGADKANANTSFSDQQNSFQAKVKEKVNTSVDLINEGTTALATSNSKVGGIISRMTGTTANTRKCTIQNLYSQLSTNGQVAGRDAKY